MMTNDEMKKALRGYRDNSDNSDNSDNNDDAVLPTVLLSLLESFERQEKNAQKRMFISLGLVLATVIAVEVAVVFLIPLM